MPELDRFGERSPMGQATLHLPDVAAIGLRHWTHETLDKVFKMPSMWRSGGERVWCLRLKECLIYLEVRPAYCDRGRWWAKVICPGYPTNPNPVDNQDRFPRFYFDLTRGKREMCDFAMARDYHPIRESNAQADLEATNEQRNEVDGGGTR